MENFRFFGGCLLLAFAALTALPAPSEFLWTVSVLVTEWGYWLALVALIPLIPSRGGQTRIGRIGAILSLGAIALFVFPVVYAKRMNSELPAALDATFGSERRTRHQYAEEPRPAPLVLPDLFGRVQSRPIRFEERTLTLGGQTLGLDIYRPGYVHTAVPGVIVIHGGRWQSGSSRQQVALNGYLAARDYIVAAINYRTAPESPFPAARDDVLSAIAYLKVHAAEFGLDATRLALVGRSAGGQLALLAAYTAGEPAIRGVVSLYGPTDLRFGYENPPRRQSFDTRGILEAYLGGPPNKVEDAYFAASPVNFVSPSSPPTLLIHGMRDGVVSPEQSARLDERLNQAGVKHHFLRLPWATHGCDASFSGPCGQVTTFAIERFLDRVMVAPAPNDIPKGKLAATRKE